MAPDVRHCKKTGPVRTATAVPCRHASSRQRRHLHCACAAPTKGPRFQASSTGIGLRQEDKARTPGAVANHGAGKRKRAGSTPRRKNTSGFRSDAPLRDPRREPGKRRRRKRPQTSFSPCLRPAAHPPCPSIPLLPCPQKNSCGTNVFGTSFPLNAHENPQQNLPDALTENRYFTRTKVY